MARMNRTPRRNEGELRIRINSAAAEPSRWLNSLSWAPEDGESEDCSRSPSLLPPVQRRAPYHISVAQESEDELRHHDNRTSHR